MQFEMTGRNRFNDPIFDCGVWDHCDLFADERIALVRVWDS